MFPVVIALSKKRHFRTSILSRMTHGVRNDTPGDGRVGYSEVIDLKSGVTKPLKAVKAVFLLPFVENTHKIFTTIIVQIGSRQSIRLGLILSFRRSLTRPGRSHDVFKWKNII